MTAYLLKTIATRVGDGRLLIKFTAVCLGLSGLFGLVQSATGFMLPHDLAYLQMSLEDLCGVSEGRVVGFMFHDRASFGGALVAIALMYYWLAEFPLAAGEAWAWWTLNLSGLVGFGSFFTFLGYGYLDTWHAAASAALLPCFVAGLWRSARIVRAAGGCRGPESRGPEIHGARLRHWMKPGARFSAGVACLVMAALGMIGAGVTIQGIAMTDVFVSTDLEFMELAPSQLTLVSPRLIPVIAHDRAAFGGAVATAGVLCLACVWFSQPTRSLRRTLGWGGVVGWGPAILVHPMIGYTDPLHLAPAVTGAALLAVGLRLSRPRLD